MNRPFQVFATTSAGPWSSQLIVVGMVQVALDEIIDMVAVGHRLVPAIGAVFVRDLVTAAIVVGVCNAQGSAR